MSEFTEWEYMVVRAADLPALVPELNRLGAVEWEVVGLVTGADPQGGPFVEALLKRRVLEGAAGRRRKARAAAAGSGG